MKTSAIPTDLISTKEAAQLLGYASSESIRYHIKAGDLRGFKNPRGYLFVSEAEAIEKLYKPEFKEISASGDLEMIELAKIYRVDIKD